MMYNNTLPQTKNSTDSAAINRTTNSYWAPIVSTIATSGGGFAIGGLRGGGIGFAVSAIEENLIKNTLINKHYISSSLFHYVMNFAPWAKMQ